MNEPCLAILERTINVISRAAIFGAAHGCFYCEARTASQLQAGECVAILNGHNAGATYRVASRSGIKELLGNPLDPPPEIPGEQRILGQPHELHGKLPLSIPPEWFPRLSMRDTFVVDELAIWFTDQGLSTGNFVWSDKAMDEVVRVVWENDCQ